MLEEISVIDQITVLYEGQVQVRRADIILREGVEIGKTYHRHIVHPGANLDAEDARVRALCRVVHTPVVVAAFMAAKDDGGINA